MNQELLANVLSAIEALITEEASNGHPAMKYRNIGKLCDHAMGIRRLGVTRVKDAGALIEEGGVGFGENPIIANEPDPPTVIGDVDDIGRFPIPQIGAHMYPRQIGAHVYPRQLGGIGRPGHDLLGNDLTQTADLIRTFSDQVASINARSNDPIAQLDKLTAVRDSLAARDAPHDQIEAIDRQIALTIATLNQETAHATDHHDSSLDDSDVPRRHSLGGRNGDVVQGDHRQGHPEGEGGTRQA